MDKCVVEVRDFRKQYGEFVAVDRISFQVYRGEIFGLLGPNGAGKTTTLECLEGLRQPDGGTLNIMGINPAHEAYALRNVIGVQLQTSGLPDNISVRESMRFFCAYHRVEPRYDLLERLGLSEKMDTQYQALSIGQKRRLALALAIAHNPPIIFLDEPTAGLDVHSRVELHTVMEELRANGTTIILSSHDMAEVEKLTDRVAILLHGKIAATGTPRDLTAHGAGLTTISVRTENGSLANVDSFPAVHHHVLKEGYNIYYSADTAETVMSILKQVKLCHDSLIDLRVERPSLEDRFLEITNSKEKAL